MNKYYQILNLQPDCSQGELRRRYLELVRQFPPEKSPERFAEIHAAYEILSNPMEQISDEIFSIKSDDSFDKILVALEKQIKRKRFSTEMILAMGKEN